MSEYIAEIIYSQYGEATVFKEKLIRCKDCKYWKKSELIVVDMICDYTYFHKYHRNADDFCSKAERKEE